MNEPGPSGRAQQTTTAPALAGMKVLDLTHSIAGPFCTKLLADHGADVIKIERPGAGDIARRAGPFPGDVPHPEKSGLFLYLNTNKRGITLNLKQHTGVHIFEDLLEQSDILVENFRPGVMGRLGLDYETLKKIKPGLVMTSISDFGQTGPYRDWKGSEITLYALSGQMSKQGDPDREPLKHALNIFQYFAGEVASVVTVAAGIRSLLNEGEGEHIDVSILETILGDVQNHIADYAYSGNVGSRTVAKNSVLYPYGAFPAKDGYVVFQGKGGGTRWVPRLFAMMGKPELKDDPRFSSPANLAKNSDDFYAIFYSWLIERSKREIFEEAGKARYPAGALFTVAELLSDPQYRERGYFVDIEHPIAGKLTYPGALFKTSEGGDGTRSPAPLLGQHNVEVYGGRLGYSAQDQVVLRNQGII